MKVMPVPFTVNGLLSLTLNMFLAFYVEFCNDQRYFIVIIFTILRPKTGGKRCLTKAKQRLTNVSKIRNEKESLWLQLSRGHVLRFFTDPSFSSTSYSVLNTMNMINMFWLK